MLSPRELDELLTQARRNEEIQHRLDQVEEFLLNPHEPATLLSQLPREICTAYRLDEVSVALLAENQGLARVLPPEWAAGSNDACFFRPRKELRLLLVGLEGPYLTNDVTRELAECFFPSGKKIASMAVLPMWVAGQMLGTLNLGSASSRRYLTGLDTLFLERLGLKVAFGLNAAISLEQARRMEQRQAVVEMAGAACHELAQPLATIELGLAKVKKTLPSDDPLQAEMDALLSQVERLGDMVHKISQVQDYVTRPYAQGMRIVDLQAAGNGGENRAEPNGRGKP